MHDDLKPFSQSLSQKFHKNSINFEKPQSLSKIPKVRLEDMKCMRQREKSTYQMKKRRSLGWKTLGKEVWSERERGFGMWRVNRSWERLRKNEPEIARILYIESLKSRQIEKCWEVLKFKLRQMHLSSSYPKVSTAKKARWIEELLSIYRGAIEHLSMD